MEDIQKFAASIKKKYQERRINCEKQWPPCLSDKLVRLEIVEREKGEGYSANTQRGREDKGMKRTPIAYGDLFKEESGKRPIRKVLVEGDAGIGKTTLCIAVSEDWANGKLFQQFEFILLLPLRMKIVSSAGSIPELLKLLHSSPRLCDSVARYLEEEEGESVLIIADGWDELSESERQKGSFLFQLLFQQFPLMSVVLTSRPSVSASLHQLPFIDRFVEVCGFSKEHIVEYIQSEFASDQEKAGHLFEQLENNPLVESVCSVPLNCAIVCHLWRTLEEALPTTMTELYTKVILLLILRNIRKVHAYNSVLSLSKFDALPADLQQSWWLLCEFAFQALEKDTLVFSQEELEEFFPEGSSSNGRFLCFGLLQSAESVGFGMSFHFLHLTFQEYLAALHLARQSQEKQLDLFKLHKSNGLPFKDRFRIVNRFFFGINRFLDFNADMSSYIQQIFECIAGEPWLNPDILSLYHCAFEAHNDFINDQLSQYLTSHSRRTRHESKDKISVGYPHTAHDCTTVLYVIANIQERVSMDIEFSNCGVRENQVKDLIDILANKKGMLKIEILILSGTRLTVSGLQALECAVLGDLLTKLKTLYLIGCLTNDADINGTWLTTFLEALSVHCPHINTLDLSDNNLDVPGASALSRMYVKEPKEHRLNKTKLGDKGLIVSIKSLKVVSQLELMDNDIHAFGTSCLADAICSGKVYNLTELNLSDNPLGPEGAIAIGRMLSSRHCSLHTVKLSRCELTTTGVGLPNTDSLNSSNTVTVMTSSEALKDVGRQLCQMPRSSKISYLELNGNSFTGEGIHILAGFIHLCPCMTHLYTNDCGITSDDLIWLFDILTQFNYSSPYRRVCNILSTWYLINNQIDDSGVSALMDHLTSLFPCLGCVPHTYIVITNNPVSDEMMKRLWEKARGKVSCSV